MYSNKLNQLMKIVNAVSGNDQTPSSISNHSPYSTLSPTQSVTDSSCSDIFDICNIDDSTPKAEPIMQYKISVKPISIPKLYPYISSSISSVSSIPSSTTLDTHASSSSLYSSVTSPSNSPSNNSIIESMNTIQFDIDCGQYMISSNGLNSGYHEWTFKVLKSDMRRQEIGVISVFNPDVHITDYDGIRKNKSFGARAIYGNIPEIKSFYYVSYNKDNSCRCNKRLSSYSSWTNNDEIKVCLDLEKGTITFMLNNKKVRKSISLQRNVKYYPIISFSDKCIYQVIH